jgi:hypothetical protein
VVGETVLASFGTTVGTRFLVPVRPIMVAEAERYDPDGRPVTSDAEAGRGGGRPLFTDALQLREEQVEVPVRTSGPKPLPKEVVIDALQSPRCHQKLAEVYLGPHIGGGIENWFAYGLALLFLLVRPEGLFGEKHIERV